MAKNTALEKLQEQHQKEEWELQTQVVKDKQQAQTLMLLGGIQVANKIARSINAQVMNALLEIQNKKMFRALGYDDFVHFLNESEYSPMTKSEFYRKRDIFKAEGGELFDLMNEIGVSMNIRKQLAAGQYDAIVIDGDKVRVGDDEADLSNLKMVKTLIESFAEEARKNRETADKALANLEKVETKVTELNSEISKLKKPAKNDEVTEILDSYLKAESALEQLISTINSSTLVNREKSAETYIRGIYARFNALKEVLGRGEMKLDESVEGEFKEVLSKINDDELAGLMG